MTQTITCRNCGADDCKHVTGSTYKCNSCTNIFTLDADEWYNPENVPADKIPDGWRFLRKDEACKIQNKPCRMWLENHFRESEESAGDRFNLTYIVPIDQDAKEEEDDGAFDQITEDPAFRTSIQPDIYNTTFQGAKLDPYQIAALYHLDGIQTQALKKLLRKGRKHKTEQQDMHEVITTCQRWLEIKALEEAQ